MGSHGEVTKRPICLNCTKPLKLCLCSRFDSPPLDNAIHVTVLQHDHEIKHPLNSTRVAKLGLKNLSVVVVSDVNLNAKIVVRPLENGVSGFGLLKDLGVYSGNGEFANGGEVSGFNGEISESRICYFNGGISDEKLEVSSLKGKRLGLAPTHLRISNGDCCMKKERAEFGDNEGNSKPGKRFSNPELDNSNDSCLKKSELNSDSDNCIIKKEMEKYRVICSNSELNIYLERTAKPNLDWVLNTPIGRKLVSNGFQVKKIHTKKKPNSTEIYETEEYNITIPPNSALLFPNEKSTNINSIDFEVKNLIVLDGTWAKAQRMYHENPWLKILPHLKLDLKKESLYSEVRHEPKEGCLSTIESIVFAMKELGEDLEGLDSILGVFESMILDQRRCKDERLSVSSQN
ncbi:hypothetical protein LUZ60_005490 [Juncus effusus]|nr:hypothetical protein LUZ60_005490 [Juncus effusus]